MSLLEIFDPKASPRPIGIDLGTTNSLVACIRNGRPEVLSDCDGESLLPSVVEYALDGSVAHVGAIASAHAVERPKQTIVSVKRMMGLGGNDPKLKTLGPYEFLPVAEGASNVVSIRVGENATRTAVEVSAEILRALKARAEDEIGSVGGVVITVPAYFDDAQRQATKDAGKLAGLEVLRLINEPTAAALAYGLETKKNGTFAVYDFGGGTFDITILLLEDGVFQVRSTGGDSALGGDDMDRLVVAAWCKQVGWGDVVPPSTMRLLLEQAKRAKHALSTELQVEVDVPVPTGGSAIVSLTRETFDAWMLPLLDRTGAACKRALRDAGLKREELDGVLLVGGSTRVPCVRSYVKELFAKEPLSDLDPEQVVALGAALQADMLAGNSTGETALLLDVIPLSLGIEVGGGVVDKVLPRNSTVPTEARATYTTQEDQQTGFLLHVVQGERELAKDCRSLARFTLKGIPPMAAGLAKLEISFHVDADGLLRVSAKEITTGIEQSVEVKPSYGLTDEDVESMLLESIDHGESDLFLRKLYESRMDAARILRGTEKAVQDDRALLSEKEASDIERASNALRKAIEGDDAYEIQKQVDALDITTRDFAKRRMDRAIGRAVAGKTVDDIAGPVR